jgi:uncharacterized protein (UPF0210 family)
VPSTKEYTPWPKRNGFICILQYKNLVLESFKDITCCVLGRDMMAATGDTPQVVVGAIMEKEDWGADAAE